MKGCLKTPLPGVDPSSQTRKCKCVAFGAEGSEEVYPADVWDRTPAEPARRLSYQDILELKEIQCSLPRVNQEADPLSGRPASHFLSPIGLLPLLRESTSPSRQASSEQLSHMFASAHDFNITGGEFFSVAGNVNIDTSQDDSTHLTNFTHVWQHHPVVLFRNGGGQLDHQTQGSESDDDPSRNTTCCTNEDGTTHKGEVREVCTDDNVQCSDLDVASFDALESAYCLSEWDDSEMKNQQPDSIQVSALVLSPSSSPSELPFEGYLILDEVIYDALSRYPPPPTGDLRSFQRVLTTLLFAFSPLSLMELAALLGLNSAQRVKQILLPASPFIFIPDSEDNGEKGDNRAPVRFVDSSMAGFFLDQTRSRRYYVDSSMAHRVLLEACICVMQRMHEEGRSERECWGWRGAYEYACRNLERHGRVIGVGFGRTRSKL